MNFATHLILIYTYYISRHYFPIDEHLVPVGQINRFAVAMAYRTAGKNLMVTDHHRPPVISRLWIINNQIAILTLGQAFTILPAQMDPLAAIAIIVFGYMGIVPVPLERFIIQYFIFIYL